MQVASLFKPETWDTPKPVPKASPAEKRSAFVGRLLAFWDTPDTPAVSPAMPEAGASAGSGDTACHSAISRRPGTKTAAATAILARGGRCLRLKVEKQKPKDKDGFGKWKDGQNVRPQSKRGTVKGFSFRSRRNLLDLVNSVDQKAAPSARWRFVTLTYHNQDVTPRQSKAQLFAFLKRLDRHFGTSGVIWKVEPQKRGKPHYHLLVFLPDAWTKCNIEAEREWFARAWVEVTNGSEEQYNVHRFGKGGADKRAGWQQLESWEHVSGYTGKYVGKVVNVPNEDQWAKAGRWWGQVNSHCLPIDRQSHAFTDHQAITLQRLMRRASVAKAREQGFQFREVPGRFSVSPELLSHRLFPDFKARKQMRKSGMFLKRQRPWIPAGLGGRLYIPEFEAVRMLLFAAGITSGPQARALAYSFGVDDIPF